MDPLDRLLGHDRWGTETLLDTCRAFSDEQLDTDFDIGHRTIRETFIHQIDNLEGWTALMIRQPPAGLSGEPSIAALYDWHARVYDRFAELAHDVWAKGTLDETFSDFYDGPMTFGSGILHVILHDAEHRTEIVHIMQRLGLADVPEVDLALWDYKRRGF